MALESLHSSSGASPTWRLLSVMSYAIVKVGGKQYRVKKGDSIVVDRMPASEGAPVALQPLLFADGDNALFEGGDLSKIKVQATVTGHERGKKIDRKSTR